MKRAVYSKYKPSGIKWLGDVPEHWTIPPLYTRYQVDLGKMLNEAAIKGDHLVPYLRNIDVQWDQTNVSDLPEMDIGPWEFERYTIRRGDLLVCEGGEVGRAAIVRDAAHGFGYQKALHRLRPLAIGEVPRFMFYTLYWATHQGVFIAGGNPNTIPHLTGEKFRVYRFPTPPYREQCAIANFLDREMAKIDTLVAKKRTLIELLKEKRTALISRTVTRGLPPAAARAAGLDPHPKLKPSGVDWLGEVPEHWMAPPLYMRYQVDLGKMLNEAAISGDHLVRYLRNVDVQWDQVNVSELPEMDIGPWEITRYTVRRGDLLVCEGGEVGRAALVGDAADGLGYQKALHRLRPMAPSEDPRFMFYTLYCAAHQGVFIAGGNPNTIPHLTGEKLRAYRFPAPRNREQRAIADYLDRETTKIDSMVAKVETAIERLQEYHIALITAAVTGKIDVREQTVDNACETAAAS